MNRETAIDNILDNFDFEKVRKVMLALNWTWFDSEEPPTIHKLYKASKKYLDEAFDKSIIDKENYRVGSGGFYAETNYNKEKNEVDYINLYFQVTNWDTYDLEE